MVYDGAGRKTMVRNYCGDKKLCATNTTMESGDTAQIECSALKNGLTAAVAMIAAYLAI